MRMFSAALIASLWLLASPLWAAEFFRISSFNIAEFGEGSHPQTRDLSFIARMLADANLDLIAIQEVGVGAQAEEQVAALTREMNEEVGVGGAQYFSSITPATGDERYAVIFRSPVVLQDDVSWLDDDKDAANPRAGGQTFFRIPVALAFSVNDFDFYVVIMHLAWGDLDRRTAEIIALREFLEAEDAEGDWILLGDMNRYGKYNKSSPNKAFDNLLTQGFETRYRFPLLEAITEPDDMKIFQSSTDEESTTVASSKNIYDQFIITRGAFSEFDAAQPALDVNVGIIAFDMDPPFNGISDHNVVKYRGSDHRPTWIRFRADLPDDD